MNKIAKQIAAWLAGKKTYLIAGGIVAVSILYAVGAIDQKTLVAVLILLSGSGAASLRAAIGKLEKP